MAKIYNIKGDNLTEEECKAIASSLSNDITVLFDENISIDIIDTETFKVLKYRDRMNNRNRFDKLNKLKFWLINIKDKIKNLFKGDKE